MIRKLLAIFLLVSIASLKAEYVSLCTEDNGSLSVGGPEFTLNPNPVNGSYFYINLKFDENEHPDAVVIINDVLGKTVFSYVIKKSDFLEGRVRVGVMDASLDKGIYFIQVKSGEQSKTLKLAIR